MSRPRVAFVVQRAGIEVNGGAEYHCLAVARAMSQVWDVEIITTCARDYRTWSDHYPPGVEDVDGVTIRRFPVDAPRNPDEHDRLSRRLRPRLTSAPLAEQEAWMRAQGPYSSSLLRYINDQRDAFEKFVFFSYLYATTYFGLPLVAEKAILAPLAHDEWPIHASLWDDFFALPAGFIFNTGEERTFLERRFPALRFIGPTIGVGVSAPSEVRAERFRNAFNIEAPFALYLGRVDPTKGLDRLFSAFTAYRAVCDNDYRLVVAGRSEKAVRAPDGVHLVGFIEESEKFDALSAADVLVQPSTFESLSIVLLEAWSVGCPVLVTSSSAVSVAQTRRAQGGLWFSGEAEFAAALSLLRGPAGARLGASGRAFVAREYDWSRVVEGYVQFVAPR